MQDNNKFQFEKLDVWSSARELVQRIYKMINKDFPRVETFGLSNQIARACVSVSSNIAEGSASNYPRDNGMMLNSAIKSLNEVVSQLFNALDLQYIDQQQFDELYQFCDVLNRRLFALRNYHSQNSKKSYKTSYNANMEQIRLLQNEEDN